MTSLRSFNPQTFDLDIYVQNVKGLGRGRGFKVVSCVSALGEPSVTNPIKDRLLDLSLLLYKQGVLSEQDLVEKFGCLVSNENFRVVEEERDALRASLEETEERLREVEQKLQTATSADEEGEEEVVPSEKLDELATLIADELGEDSDDWDYVIDEYDVEEEGSRSYTKLRYGLERLIEDHAALKASTEE